MQTIELLKDGRTSNLAGKVRKVKIDGHIIDVRSAKVDFPPGEDGYVTLTVTGDIWFGAEQSDE